MTPIIKTKQLTKTYKNNNVVDNLNLEVLKGTIHGFLGPNGSGKTTTIKMLLDLIQPNNGQINIFGKDLKTNRNAILKEIGSFVESPSFYGNLTGYENLQVVQEMLNNSKDSIIETLETVGLLHAKDKLAKEYSLGMKQRLGLAFALLNKPKLLILDEPTNGLDPSGIHEIRELIKTLATKHGYTIFLSSHNLNEIELLASHVTLINEGNMIYQGPLNKVLGEGNEVQIGTNNLLEAKEFLESNGHVIDLNNNEHYLTTRGGKETSIQINNQLVNAGYDVFHIYCKKRTLEETFLHLTKKNEVEL
jgi:ABC-2 type transport system ATP-binding protein